MANIQLVHEANLAVAECNDDANTWTVPHEDETSTKSTNVSMLFDGDSQQEDYLMELHETTVSEYNYQDSDADPLDSSDDECELLSDDDGTLIEDFLSDAMTDDEIKTNVASFNVLPAQACVLDC